MYEREQEQFTTSAGVRLPVEAPGQIGQVDVERQRVGGEQPGGDP